MPPLPFRRRRCNLSTTFAIALTTLAHDFAELHTVQRRRYQAAPKVLYFGRGSVYNGIASRSKQDFTE